MRIDELLAKGRPSVSFEFFPPRTESGFVQLYRVIEDLRSLSPTYVSVTYGAGGSTRQKTVALVEKIQREAGIRAMAHLTCVGHTTTELAAVLDELWKAGIRNVLALRGDPPAGQMQFVPTEGGLSHADELVSLARSRHDFCIGVAGYPEGHPQCLNRIRDLEHLKKKVENGANLIITQLFFDNADFRFRDAARGMGIRVPIIAGIMPITNVAQIKRFIGMCGARIPHPLLLELERLENDADAVQAAGIEYATRQCQDLLAKGADGIHFYTLNKSTATVQVCREIAGPYRGLTDWLSGLRELPDRPCPGGLSAAPRGSKHPMGVSGGRGTMLVPSMMAIHGFGVVQGALALVMLALSLALVAPRYADALLRERAQAAAERIAADLAAAQRRARMGGGAKVCFQRDHEQLPGDRLGRRNGYLRGELSDPPLCAMVFGADLGEGLTISFDGMGIPDHGGSITVGAGETTRTITIDPASGATTIA